MSLFLSVLCLCQLLFVGCASDGWKMFMVQVGSNSKPTIFFTHKWWYTSTVTLVKVILKTEWGSLMGALHDDTVLLHVYNIVFQGFSTRLREHEAEEMQRAPGILAIFPNHVLQLKIMESWYFLGLDMPNANHWWVEFDYNYDLVIGMIDFGQNDGASSIGT